MTEAAAPTADAAPTPPPRMLAVLIVLAAAVGVVVSLAAWCFLEAVHQVQHELFTDLPSDMGYHSPRWWWYVLVLGVAGVLVALAIMRLPGRGGHIPAEGLKVGGAPTQPTEIPGVVLAAFATIALGLVLGPEAPLIAMGGGLGLLAIRLARRDSPPQVQVLLAAAGSFTAMSFLFDQPIIAAVILIEATGLGKRELPLLLLPGLTAAGIGSLVSIGMGSWTGLSSSAYSIGALPLPVLAKPDLAEFAWTIPLAVIVAIAAVAILQLGRSVERVVVPRILVMAPAAGMIVAGLAIAFSHAAGKSASEVLFSGQDQLPGLVSGASTWSISALLLLLGFKGLAWGISLGSFRGGPTFPALFLGAAGGILASHLPGFNLTAAVAVGMAAALAAALKLPLSAVVVASLLAGKSGPGVGPLVIVAVVVAYLTTLAISRRQASAALGTGEEAAPTGPRETAAGASAGAGAGA
jgi:chloride channel protein, CIC family